MRNGIRKAALVVAGIGLVVGGGIALNDGTGQEAKDVPASEQASDGVEETTLQGFELDTSPAAMIAFEDNKLIVEGTVRDEGERRVLSPKAAGGDLWYVYRPVHLVVTAVHRGDAKVGEVVTLRVIGGEAAGRRTVFHDAPPDGTFAAGKKLLVFGVGKLDAGDGVVAVTPNATYEIKGTEAVNAGHVEEKASLQSIRAGLKAAAKKR